MPSSVTNNIIMAIVALVLGAGAGIGIGYWIGSAQDNEKPACNSHDNTRAVTNSRPTNQVAVLTVWAEESRIEETADFYERILGLSRVGTGTEPYVLDTDGSCVAIMPVEKHEPPVNPARRWPEFALAVEDIYKSVNALTAANVNLPWGVEEFPTGSASPTSRYVMFQDPAGNLIELVQWY